MFDSTSDGFLDLDEFAVLYQRAVIDQDLVAADIIWFTCRAGTDELDETQAYACYEAMCARYCTLDPDTSCTCEDHEHSIVLVIYDLDGNGSIDREEFNSLVDDAEWHSIPWPHYNYTTGYDEGENAECKYNSTVAGEEVSIAASFSDCCEAGLVIQGYNLTRACE